MSISVTLVTASPVYGNPCLQQAYFTYSLRRVEFCDVLHKSNRTPFPSVMSLVSFSRTVLVVLIPFGAMILLKNVLESGRWFIVKIAIYHHCIESHQIALITSNYIKSHRIELHQITSNRIKSNRIESSCIESNCIASNRIKLH